MKNIVLPKGFEFKIKKSYGSVLVELYVKRVSYPIGRVKLNPIGEKAFETHSHLDPAYHNRGLGALMYAKAIRWCLKHGYKVRSSGYSSPEAQRVWKGKTLRKLFSIRKRKSSEGVAYDKWYVSKK